MRFRFLINRFTLGAAGALLFFDITNMVSFINIQKWIQILRNYNLTLPLVLVGTKQDLEDLSMISDYYAYLTQKRFNMIDYIKTSSKQGLNVYTAFNILADHLIENEGLINNVKLPYYH